MATGASDDNGARGGDPRQPATAVGAGPRYTVVDRRALARVTAQPDQLTRVHGGSVLLPDPRPCTGRKCVLAIEKAPVRVQVAGQALVNGARFLDYTTIGAVELVSTGESWLTIGAGATISVDAPAPLPGPTGPAGADGLEGPTGATGQQGPPARLPDAPLPRVLPGPPGSPGGPGVPGLGIPGRPGEAGMRGFPGLQGPSGATGPTGPAGADTATPPGRPADLPLQRIIPGPAGAQGPTGETGPAGAGGSGGGTTFPGRPVDLPLQRIVPGRQGVDGAPGAAGAAGSAGAPGAPGRPGLDAPRIVLPGPAGVAGPAGATGPTGPAGSAGAGLVASVDVNLGTVPLWSGTFTISGLSGLTPGDAVIVTRGIGAGGVSEEAEDEAQESVSAAGKVITSSTIMVQWESANGPIAGTRRFYYAMLTGQSGPDFTSIARADPDVDNANALLSVIPQFNWSQARVAHHAEFLGASAQAVPIEGFTPGGHLKCYPVFSTSTGSALHPGVLRCVVPLGRTGYLHMGQFPGELLWNPTEVMGFRVILRLVTANPTLDYDVTIGLLQSTETTNVATSTGNAIALFTRVSGPNAVWALCAQTGGSASLDNGPLIVVNDWDVIEVLQQSTGVWEWFVNGVSEGTVSTNVPTGVMTFGLIIADDGGGTTDFIVDIDSLTIFGNTLAARFT